MDETTVQVLAEPGKTPQSKSYMWVTTARPTPAELYVLRHIQKKYTCPCCEGHVVTAAKPPQPIPKSVATPSLLAWVAVSKYQDALPLYRQSAIFERLGVHLDRTTLANWMIQSGPGAPQTL